MVVETPWERVYKFILLIFGIPFFLIGLIIQSLPFTINGLIWIFFAAGLKIKSIYNKHKLENLKRKGL